MPIATLEELKQRLNLAGGNTEDPLLGQLLESAIQRVEGLASRRFGRDPEDWDEGEAVTKVCWAANSTWCPVPDLYNVEGISANGTDVLAATRLVRLREGHPAHALVLPTAAGSVTVTGYWGFKEVPPAIRDAVLAWAQRVYHEHRSRLADSTVDPDGVAEHYFRSVPVFVSVAIDLYRVPGT